MEERAHRQPLYTMNRPLRSIAAALGAIAFLGLLIPLAARAEETAAATAFAPSQRTREHLGKDITSALDQAVSVEVFRVGKKLPPDAAPGFVDQFVISKAVAPPADLLARALTAFGADRTYFSSDSKGCAVGVGFRFRTATGAAVLLRCCVQKGNIVGELLDPAGAVVTRRDLRGFREDKAALVRALAAELFPGDAQIQKYAPKPEGSAAPGVPAAPAKDDAANSDKRP